MAEFRFTEKEYVGACIKMQRKRFIRVTGLAVLAFGLIAFSQIYKHGILLAIPFALLALIFPCAILFLTRRRLTKAFREQKTFQEKFQMAFSSEGIQYTHESGSNKMTWDRVRRWDETKDFFYLYESDLFARIIPKRVISPDEETLLRSHLQNVRRV